jgi:hypothetical protein
MCMIKELILREFYRYLLSHGFVLSKIVVFFDTSLSRGWNHHDSGFIAIQVVTCQPFWLCARVRFVFVSVPLSFSCFSWRLFTRGPCQPIRFCVNRCMCVLVCVICTSGFVFECVVWLFLRVFSVCDWIVQNEPYILIYFSWMVTSSTL